MRKSSNGITACHREEGREAGGVIIGGIRFCLVIKRAEEVVWTDGQDLYRFSIAMGYY